MDVFAEYLSGLEMQGSSKTSDMDSHITGKYMAVTSERLYYLFVRHPSGSTLSCSHSFPNTDFPNKREANLAVPNNSHDLRRALHDFPCELKPVRLPQAEGEIRPSAYRIVST